MLRGQTHGSFKNLQPGPDGTQAEAGLLTRSASMLPHVLKCLHHPPFRTAAAALERRAPKIVAARDDSYG